MQALDIAAGLEGFQGRGAGTDAERRAANWLADQLTAGGREATLETFWCRPNTALAQAWHVALALAGSLASVPSPKTGAALLLAAIVFVLADALTGVSPGRRLTPERASQNVVSPPPEPGAGDRDTDPPPLRLILTANYDAGRMGLVHRDWLRRPFARLRRLSRGITPGWLGWLLIALIWLEAAAIIRVEGHGGAGVGLVQLPPTVAIVIVLALLLELGTAEFSPAAGDNGTGVGVVLVLTRALDTARHRHLRVEVVLAGAGELGGVGFRRYLRKHGIPRQRASTAVIGSGAGSEGRRRRWQSDGPLLPLRYGMRLRQLAVAKR